MPPTGRFFVTCYLSCDPIERSIERSWARAGCAVCIAGDAAEPSFSSPPSGRLTAYLSTRRSQAVLAAMYESTAKGSYFANSSSGTGTLGRGNSL